MSLEDRGAQHDKVIVDKYANPNANYQMTTRDYVVRPLANGASGAITVTLPPVGEAKGRFYSIVSRGANAVQTITIADKNDSECWVADIVLNSKCDKVLMYSDGLCWHPLGAGSVGGWVTGATRAPGTAVTTLAPTTLATTAAPTTLAPTTTGT